MACQVTRWTFLVRHRGRSKTRFMISIEDNECPARGKLELLERPEPSGRADRFWLIARWEYRETGPQMAVTGATESGEHRLAHASHSPAGQGRRS